MYTGALKFQNLGGDKLSVVGVIGLLLGVGLMYIPKIGGEQSPDPQIPISSGGPGTSRVDTTILLSN